MHWNVSPVAYPTGPFGQLFFVVCVSVVVFLCFFLLLSLWSGDLLFLCGFVPVFCTLLIPFPPSVHSSLSSFLFLLLSFCISSSHPSLPPSYLPGSLTLSLLPLSPPLWVQQAALSNFSVFLFFSPAFFLSVFLSPLPSSFPTPLSH